MGQDHAVDADRAMLAIAGLYDGRALEEKLGVAAILSTVDEQGWPRAAFLSVGEVLIEPGRAALMLWSTSSTSRNMARERRAVLMVGVEGSAFALPLTVEKVSVDPKGYELVAASIGEPREHAAPYARVDGLVGFTLDEPAATIVRWREQIDRLHRFATQPEPSA